MGAAAVSCTDEGAAEEKGAVGMWYPADMSDLHVGHVMHDLCKINSHYEEGGLFSV